MSAASFLNERENGQPLRDHNRRVQDDLEVLGYPAKNWPKPRLDASGKPIADVVIIGGGMCGLVAYFALARAGIRHVRILDRAPAGSEGPWLTYARMETLRSPKGLLGPASGIPSLSYRLWHIARFGRQSWEEMYRIPRPLWMAYLAWFREILQIPVENEIAVERLVPAADGSFELALAGGGSIRTRKVVLATGRDGLGGPAVPGFMAELPRRRWSHSSDQVDFETLRDKRVVVIGVGASAVDNAAEALEHGAAEVRLLARRTRMPTINKLMGIGSYGVTAGFPTLPAAWRWRLMNYAMRQQTPAPKNSTLRVSRHANAYFHFGCAIASMREVHGEIEILTAAGRLFHADHVLLGTGFTVDPRQQPLLEPFAADIACWGDRYSPPVAERNPELARYPWLNADFSFDQKAPGTAAGFLRHIHCFNYAAALSLGKVSGDIPAISEGARWLAQGISGSLFASDIESHWHDLQMYEEPELDGSEWRDADALIPAGAPLPAATVKGTP